MLLNGLGGPLVFLWSLGTGLFLLVLNLPEYALVWTGATIALGFGMMHFYLGDSKIRQLLLGSTIAIGNDADLNVLKKIANYGHGRNSKGQTTIDMVMVYTEIARYF